MREALKEVGVPEHWGLAYDAWAPVGNDGKVSDGERGGWLSDLAALAIPSDYPQAFERWKASFRAPGDRAFESVLASRLLVGHGYASAVDIGITVHHTWGVPVIPGSALKGLLAHYMDAVYGPDAPHLPPWEQAETERDRARYQGVTWRGRRIERGPGEVYRALFGAPEAEKDMAMREHGFAAGSFAGPVVFNDALYVPQSSPDDKPFAADVLTVHQKGYYDSAGQSLPNDYDSPNPISFLTVRPGTRMLVVLSGPSNWTELAEQLLKDALEKWGVGGKTSAGYGRFLVPDSVAVLPPSRASDARTFSSAPSGPKHARGDKITVTRVDDPKGKMKFCAPDGLLGHFVSESPPGIDVGGTTEVWVANVVSQGYTFTLQQPIKKEKKGRR